MRVKGSVTATDRKHQLPISSIKASGRQPLHTHYTDHTFSVHHGTVSIWRWAGWFIVKKRLQSCIPWCWAFQFARDCKKWHFRWQLDFAWSSNARAHYQRQRAGKFLF